MFYFKPVMCILFIYRNPSADSQSYKLIVASNRDEMLKRPALPAYYWKDYTGCVGGIDMEPGKEGGTWFALSIKGKAGVTLNLSNEPRLAETPAKGRGSLITDYITTSYSTELYLQNLHTVNQKDQLYNSYNLVLIELKYAKVFYLNSSMGSTGPHVCEDNILGFSNSKIESPYKKVEAGKEKLRNIVENATVLKQDDLIEDLLKLLKSKERHLPDPELQRRCPTMYKELSSIFVAIDQYGTRTHSILLVDGANKVTFVEETLMPDFTWKRQSFVDHLLN